MEYKIDVVNIRLVKEPSLYSTTPIKSPEDVLKVIGKEMSEYDREMFGVLNLATDGKVINFNIVSMGTLSVSVISPREVFKSSILANAANIIAVHNHPSGNTKPSKDDMKITTQLSEAGNLLGIPLLDHIIIGGTTGEQFSFRGNDLMNN